MQVKIIYNNNNKSLPDNLNWFSIRVTGIPRFLVIEWNRHRSISTTQKSSRFTLQEIKGKSVKLMNTEPEIWGKYIYLTGSDFIDTISHQNLARTALALEEGFKNDEVKSTLPEGFLLDGVWTMTYADWRHLYELRGAKGAIKPFRKLVELIKREISKTDPDIYERCKNNFTPLVICSTCIRECYNTHDKSDNGGPKDLNLIKRIGVVNKHQSTLEHLRFRTSIQLPYNKFIEYDNKTKTSLLNMRVVLEDPNIKGLLEYFNEIPKEYKYLLGE